MVNLNSGKLLVLPTKLELSSQDQSHPGLVCPYFPDLISYIYCPFKLTWFESNQLLCMFSSGKETYSATCVSLPTLRIALINGRSRTITTRMPPVTHHQKLKPCVVPTTVISKIADFVLCFNFLINCCWSLNCFGITATKWHQILVSQQFCSLCTSEDMIISVLLLGCLIS